MLVILEGGSSFQSSETWVIMRHRSELWKNVFVVLRMTPQQVKLVGDSFAKVLPIAGVTADLFYDHLFEIAPEVRPLFPDDLVEQKKNSLQCSPW